jgi:predicted glycoside hydrolase/deacetylase ChbG (UPF0249 family)
VINKPIKRIIITADDFGLSPEINEGIVRGYLDGVVRSAALLMNAPGTAHAIALAKKHPGLEVGIHLGIVEGICLTATDTRLSRKVKSITEKFSYFEGRPCLLKSWKTFCLRYLFCGISFTALQRELETQLLLFQKEFGNIPFANSTQHLHLLPGISELVLDLADTFGIKSFRCHSVMPDSPPVYRPRWAAAFIMKILGKRFRSLAKMKKISMPDGMFGFAHSGHLDFNSLIKMISQATEGTYEIMTHPGLDCPQLKLNLPWAFEGFNWLSELSAVTNPLVKEGLRTYGLELINFRSLELN